MRLYSVFLDLLQILIISGSESQQREVHKSSLWSELHACAMKQFHHHLRFVIDTLISLIESDVKNFKLIDDESKNPIQSLNEIVHGFPENDKQWKDIQFKNFSRLSTERGNESLAQYIELVMQKFNEIDWNLYGNRAFDQIKEVITIFVDSCEVRFCLISNFKYSDL